MSRNDADPACPPSVRIQIGRSLARLNRSLHTARRRDRRAHDLLGAWHCRWSERRDRIERGLHAIGRQLEALVADPVPVPQFAVVDAPERSTGEI